MKYRQPHRIKKKKSVLKNKFFWVFLLILIWLGVVFYLVCFASFFQIKDFKISGNNKVSSVDIESIIKKGLEQKFFLVPQKSIFLFNSENVKKEALKTYPQISTINIKREMPSTLLFNIEERVLVAVWCYLDNCFSIDKEGIIFEEAKTDNADFVIISQEGKKYNLGDEIIETNLMQNILEIQKKLNNIQIKVKNYEILNNNQITANTLNSWKIYFDKSGDMKWQLTELLSVLGKQIPPESQGNLEYIDLRFSKVYYKFR